jgi:hypothetical protein
VSARRGVPYVSESPSVHTMIDLSREPDRKMSEDSMVVARQVTQSV